MHRRDLLVATGSVSALGGCLGHLPVPPHSRPTARLPAVTARPDPVPPDRDAALDATVVRQFSTRSPARVRVAYTNTAAEEREVVFGTTVPFPPYAGARTDGAGRLSLVPDDREFVHPFPRPESTPAGDPFVPAEPSGGCWRARAAVAGMDVARERLVGPDETIQGTYTVLAHPESGTCLADGTYRFEDGNYLGWDRPWGFELVLER